MQKVLLAATALTTALMTSGCVIVVDGDSDGDSKMVRGHAARTADGYVVLDRDGDYSRLAGDLNLRGRIGGDLSLVAGDIDADDLQVGGDVSIAGGEISFSGRIGREASIAGGDIQFTATVGDELSLAGAEVDFDGRVEGEAALAAAEMTVGGWFGDELHAHAEDIRFTGEATGPVTFVSAKELNRNRRNRDRGHVEISGSLENGGQICAIDVVFTDTARVRGTITVWSENAPVTQSGAQVSGLDYQPRNGRDCDDLIDD
ncbi:hypothetical protein [Maricaulis sp.]|uniref:hypothetical protein n=1 Tax=Maricaulis sp. TaxID=1486257 RepID=UPI003A8EDBE9